MCCHYVTVGIIRDELGGDRNDKTLVRHILRDQDPARDAYAFTLYLMGDAEFKGNPRNVVYTLASLDDALAWVRQDVAKIARQRDQQSRSGSPPSHTPPTAISFSRNHMTREEILLEVHKHIDDFFRGKWIEFREKVEKYTERCADLSQQARQAYSPPSADEAEQIGKASVEAQRQLEKAKQKRRRVSISWRQVEEKYDRIFKENRQKYHNAKKQLPPAEMPAFFKGLDRKLMPHRKKLRQLAWRWQVLDEEIPRLEYQTNVGCYSPGPSDQPPGEGYVRAGGMLGALKGDAFVRFFGCTLFWKPADLVNPASWFGLTPDSPQVKLSWDDQVLHDAVVLCVAYDDAVKDQGGVPRIYPNGTYDRRLYFRCDEFVRALAERLRQPESDVVVQSAWKGVEARLPRPEPPALRNDADKGEGTQSETSEQSPTTNREKPWDKSCKGFIHLGVARQRYCTSGKAPKVPCLSKRCKPDGPFDYMRKRGKGARVHEQQFAAWAHEKGYTVQAVREAEALVVAHKNSPAGRMERLHKENDVNWQEEIPKDRSR
jgi:hypothetical protein